MQTAPFYDDVSQGPEGGCAYWVTASDGVKLRIGVWPRGSKGTVLMMPGRTEYIEKYGRAAQDLADRGYATVSIDWRGQGLSARLLDNPMIGHVGRFGDFRFDVKAMVRSATELGLPRPFYLMSHSMGGCIALRALIEGINVNAAVFSAPMWGILINPLLRPVAVTLAVVSRPLGFGRKLLPSTSNTTYVAENPFLDNLLTTDPDMYDYMQRQIAAHPNLALGGPSIHWLNEALSEVRALSRLPSPKMPTLTALGSRERIVDPAAIAKRMENWTGGTLHTVEGAEHEVMMETPSIRKAFFDDAAALFDAHP